MRHYFLLKSLAVLCAAIVVGCSPQSAPAPAPVAPGSDTKPAAATDTKPASAGPVVLGTGDLTVGIPGDGPLAIADIQRWLDNPAHHTPLTFQLPKGLDMGQKALVVPADNPLTRAKIELGRQLYFDGRLSADGTVSCASCHDPAEGYSKHTPTGVGIGGQLGGRNSPVSYNRILSGPQFWDGRAASLEEQAKGPIANPIEMGNTHAAAVITVQSIAGYKMQFDKVFAGEGITIDTIAKAIAAFERALVTGPSPYDYYDPVRNFESVLKNYANVDEFKSDDPEAFAQYQTALAESAKHPISDSAKRGRDLFFGKANCTACHAGANFTDELYHNIGIGMDREKPDLGRFDVTKQDKDRGAFKTPTVRNTTKSAPYMHDGSLKTLEEVVEWYDKGGHPNPQLSEKMKKLNLTPQEKKDLVAFMQALDGAFPQVATGRFPQ